MKKLLAAAIVSSMIYSTVARADVERIQDIEGYFGGFYVSSTYGNWCEMGYSDPGANLVYSTAITAKANGDQIWMQSLSQAGQGAAGAAGAFECDYILAR